MHSDITKYLLISRNARDKYNFEETLFAKSGNVVFANFHAVHSFVQQINEKRNLAEFPEKAATAGDINGIGLIHEVLHYIVELFMEEKQEKVFQEAYDHICQKFTKDKVTKTLTHFVDEFPPPEVYQNELTPEKYVETNGTKDGHTFVSEEEMVLLWLANTNPAFADYLELFNDESLEKETIYPDIITELRDFFEKQPPFGPDDENLIDMLRAPALAVPHSIPGQIEWMRENWGGLLKGKLFYRLLRGLDFIKEETKARFMGPGPVEVYQFGGEPEYERFSSDRDWMPSVVLLAKNTYVWLHQLSEKYNCQIERLDQIPDEELEWLAKSGFTGLWLIGLWERSKASKLVKQQMGNPEAVASAYSLYDYDIAEDLGGNKAYNNLRHRSRQKGVRLCGDMVPNHVGIDGKWVIEHPHWFVSRQDTPFPSYTFNSPNISHDDRVGLHLEDHYYERTDAAVVFKRVDHHTGDTRYIYHGNDGTSMPWNDTAQLDYTKSEVREAVIQTILHVARNFDIIRFDAAMTLAKKHFQRLWFPEPGTGGDIPSRAEYGLTKADFDTVFPEEFWREVVDRVAAEEPDTLLLAEAFWLMEGYFVRTLGMHRVYNSAFMHMLKNEDNQKYKNTIKNVLEFNPGILKRFVNFMNNPDEETAHVQFGTDDKYFGTCIMMATLPGLPMFGHGQVEGYREKYGMEYKRSYWDEKPNPHLIARHEREVFPVLHKRYLFAEVENFNLYDLHDAHGNVNENVFAYSNRIGDERALVIYNNKYDSAAGWIKNAAPFMQKAENVNHQNLVHRNLAEGLNLKNEQDIFYIFRDHIAGLEFIRNSKAIHEQGLFVEAQGFKYHVFWEFREVRDSDNLYAELAAFLNGRGVPSVEEALQETLLRPVHSASRKVFNTSLFELITGVASGKEDAKKLAEVESTYEHFLTQIQEFSGSGDIKSASEAFSQILKTQLGFIQEKAGGISANAIDRAAWFAWLLTSKLGKLETTEKYAAYSRSMIDEYYLGKIIAEFCNDLNLDENEQAQVLDLVKINTLYQDWFTSLQSSEKSLYQIIQLMLQNDAVRTYLGVNRYQDVLWFNSERFENLLRWFEFTALTELKINGPVKKADTEKLSSLLNRMEKAKEASGYKLANLIEALK